MRAPAPERLLVDHPALPLPAPHRGSLRLLLPEASAARRLSRQDRRLLAVQLLAATSLLAELELWPGRGALRRALLVEGAGGWQAVIPGLPQPLGAVFARLGGGERAAELTRDAAVAAVAAAVDLPPSELASPGVEPGFYLLPSLERLLAALPGPLDAPTARSLWALRWDTPALPEPGEIAYLAVPHAATAQRLAAAAFAALARAGQPAWWEQVAPERVEPPALAGTLVLCGSFAPRDLEALEAWVQAGDRSALVLGVFPPGWEPPPPRFDAVNLGRHLAVTGIPLDRARQEVSRRSGRFNPLLAADREAMTHAASGLFRDAAPRRAAAEGPEATVERLLGLLPEGLPEPFLVERSGLRPALLGRAAANLGSVVRGEAWALPEPVPLRRDPLHREVAELFPSGDPRALRHLALGGGGEAPLLEWARALLDDLANEPVRALLAEVAPGELGDSAQALLVEACLGELDLAGARRALAGLPPAAAAPFERWAEAADHSAGWQPSLPPVAERERWPRPTAEVALRVMRQAVTAADPDALKAAREVAAAAVERLRGALRRWYEIELAVVDEPDLLRRREWRARMADGNPRLARQLAHRRARQLEAEGRPAAALRVLSRLAAAATAPGWQGVLQHDLGAIALSAGRTREAEAHHLRAYRLLQVSGSRNRIRSVLFNLAVSDVDRLEVARAGRRLAAAAQGHEDFFTLAERARIALAVGDEQQLATLVAALPEVDTSLDPKVGEAFSFLRGAQALLAGNLDTAGDLFASGGEEGLAWLAVARAAQGHDYAEAEPDTWGVWHAARLLAALARGGVDGLRRALPAAESPSLQQALGLALAVRLAPAATLASGELRQPAAELLERQGLVGWARLLRSQVGDGSGFLQAAATLVDVGQPSALPPEEARGLLAGLGLTGLEVHEGRGGRVVWRVGEGRPGRAVVRAQVEVVPLGGEAGSGPAWQLLLGLLPLLLPVTSPGPDPEAELTGIHGRSKAAVTLRRELETLAPRKVTVVLLGETGAGKEVAASALHRLSGRRGRLVPVNVAGIPASLIESELFGSLRGAYTGADRSRQGMVLSADKGTLFLDEIGDLDLALQVKLLRFLESSEVRPVGSDRSVEVDVRVVAATHRDLPARVREGSFREDLYYRLAQTTITIPPLRERVEDIPLLRSLFEREFAAREGLPPVRFSREASSLLERYPWPGNVRELRHVVEGAMLRARGGVVQADDLQIAVPEAAPARTGWEEELDRFRRKLLEETLARTGGNRTLAARELGLSRQTLLYHMRKLGIS